MNAKTMIILGILALPALQGYLWVRAGETWKAVLLGVGIASGLAVAGWAWHRWKKSRTRVYDSILVKEKTSSRRIRGRPRGHGGAAAPTAVRSGRGSCSTTWPQPTATTTNAAGARFRVGKVRPAVLDAVVNPPRRGLLQSRNVLGMREAAALWHPPGPGDDMPLIERSGSKDALAFGARK